MTDMIKLNGRPADQEYGYEFGCDGVMSSQEACEFLGGVSWKTLQRKCDDGLIRKGKIPGGQKTVYCRRSVREYIRSMEV